MNSIARALWRHRLNTSRFYRQLFVPAIPRANDEKSWNFRNQNNFFKFAGFCAAGVLGYELIKDYFPSLPQVHAATTTTSKRAQFNFIADVVEVASKSLVYIEIQDARRMDYRTGKPLTISNGSGFVIDSNGLILTNAHVVVNKPHSIVSVELNDGRQFQGIVEAVDPVSDLATVRINCKNLPTMKLGDSSSVRSGEWVVALGSPLALSNTCTAGVVSSTERPSQDLGLTNRDIKYIQTDAAITFGNSGGPLVNLDNEAIGINSMKVTSGISFAIPINYVKNFLKLAEEKLKQGNKVIDAVPKRRYMGITMLTLTSDMINELRQRGTNLYDHITHGILIYKVIYGSPAHRAGLMAGDIVISINKQPVQESNDIYEFLKKDGSSHLVMELYRGRTKMKLSVVPEDAE